MSESVIYDARFLCDVHLSSLRASSHCLNLHPISPWPRPWTQTSPSEKTTDFVLKNNSLLLAFKYSPYEIVHNRTCVFERSVVLQVWSDQRSRV